MKKTGVYILRCKNGSYYTGSTDDLERRMEEHKRGKSKSTKNLLPVELIAFIEFNNVTEARKMESQVKRKKSRIYLESLIEIHSVKR